MAKKTDYVNAEYILAPNGDMFTIVRHILYCDAFYNPHDAYAQFSLAGTYEECIEWMRQEHDDQGNPILPNTLEWQPLAIPEGYSGMIIDLLEEV